MVGIFCWWPQEDSCSGFICKNETPSLLKGDVYQAAQDSFCDNESHDFLKRMQLVSTLNSIDHVSNIKKLLLRRASLLRGSILDHILHHSGDKKNPMTLILIWDTGSSYELTPFRSDLIDDVECDIPIKGCEQGQ